MTTQETELKTKLTSVMENRGKIARALKIRELQIQKHSIEASGWHETNQTLSEQMLQVKDDCKQLGVEKADLEKKLDAMAVERETLRAVTLITLL